MNEVSFGGKIEPCYLLEQVDDVFGDGDVGAGGAQMPQNQQSLHLFATLRVALLHPLLACCVARKVFIVFPSLSRFFPDRCGISETQ